jgi:hypothetical protein
MAIAWILLQAGARVHDEAADLARFEYAFRAFRLGAYKACESTCAALNNHPEASVLANASRSVREMRSDPVVWEETIFAWQPSFGNEVGSRCFAASPILWASLGRDPFLDADRLSVLRTLEKMLIDYGEQGTFGDLAAFLQDFSNLEFNVSRVPAHVRCRELRLKIRGVPLGEAAILAGLELDLKTTLTARGVRFAPR